MRLSRVHTKIHSHYLENVILLPTCRELLEMTCRIANVLKQLGVKKHDKVVIYMPAFPPAVASMLACARIGAVHRLNPW